MGSYFMVTKQRIYEVDYAGYAVRYAFRNSETKLGFGLHLRRSEADTYEVFADPAYISEARSLLPEDVTDGYVEYRSLVGLTSLVLLKHRRCIFHAVSFVFKGKAWLLTAPSGAGKTTQYLNWQRLFPDEITMISGDMPTLKLEEDGKLSVHSSPWNGKEKIGSFLSAPLGGVVFLEKGKENRIEHYMPQEALLPLIGQFMVLPETEEDIYSLIEMLTALITRHPVAKFINLGNDMSTALLREWTERVINDIV